MARHIAEDQRQPQPIAGGFMLHAGELHARLDARGIELADGWRFAYVGDATVPEVDGRRVLYHRGGGVTEWYEALPEGIEQGFTVAELPPDGEDLVMRGKVTTRAAARVVDGGVRFGELQYDGLVIADAGGRPLRGAIEWDARSQTLAVRVPASELVNADLPIVIDPLLSVAAWTVDPTNQASADFGYSVAGAGDVNGDGFADVIVGALSWDGTATDEGRAYLFLGSAAGLAVSPSWTADPTDQASARFGTAVAGVGDVNRDGFGDVVVGAGGWNGAAIGEGRAYLFLGSAAGLAASATWNADPTDQTGAVFANSVAGAGDVNGDGFADVLMTAADWDGPAGGEMGRAYLYLGDAGGLAASPAWTANPTGQSSSYLGSVAGAGDVNGDGFADVIVGARAWDGTATNEGRAYVYLGSAAGLAVSPAWTADPTDQFNAQFGYSVAGAGDVNGDGFADVVVGAAYWDGATGTDEGRAYLYLGSAAGLATSPAWIGDASDQANSNFGFSMAGAGDVNGDGFADVLVTANAWDGAMADEGRAYLFLGSAAGLGTVPAWATDPTDQSNAQFGVAVASAGDINGDGFADVVVGANGWDSATTDEGRAYLYLGAATGLGSTTAWTAESDQASAQFGYSVAAAGDVNGDGYGDVVVGAFYFDNGQTDEGRAYLYLGSATGLSATATWTAEPDQAGAWFAYSAASAGDVNGDGYGDVVIGAFYFDGGEVDEGRAYLYLGSATGLSPTAAWTAESNQAGAGFGVAVASAGDVNGDGFADVVVGASAYDGGETDEGRAYLYLGSATGLSPTAAWTAESNQASAQFGHGGVASAGDVNGDGHGDVVVGAPSYDNGQTDEGRAYLYLGTATGLSATAAWTAESDQVDARFAWPVVSAGDVNADGYGDVVVGAYQYSNGQTREGRAYLYLGSATGLSATAVWTTESDQTGALLGWGAVASAGDVNGDGYGDVVVGASAYDNGQTDEGRTYVYLGSATGLAATAAWMAESDQVSAYFGVGVASAGDVNGDGYGDVVVGAHIHDGGQTNEGKAFLYLGGDGGAPGLARGLAQLRADGTTRIGVGTSAGGTGVVLRGRVTQEGAVGARLRLEVEVALVGMPFTGTATMLSAPVTGVAGGTVATATITGLGVGAYRWRARVVYPVGTGHGRWVAFGGNSEVVPDFRVLVAPSPNGVGCSAGSQCASGTCEDGLCCAVTCGLCNSCNPAGTACGVQPVDDATCGAIDCDLLDTTCRNYADLTAGRCAALGTCKAANGAACTIFNDVSGACSDGDACTSGDACAAGTCGGGTAITCSDTNLCTTDSCNPALGCVFTNNTSPCDDGDTCTTTDTCAEGTCVGSGNCPDAGMTPDASVDASVGIDANIDADIDASADAGRQDTSLLACNSQLDGRSDAPAGRHVLGLAAVAYFLLLRRRRRQA